MNFRDASALVHEAVSFEEQGEFERAVESFMVAASGLRAASASETDPKIQQLIYTSPTFQSSTSVGAFPELPPVLVQGETISDLAVTVYSRDVMALSIVPVVDASHTFSFSPAASLDFTLSQTQVVSITIGGGQTNASGTYWIQYMAMSSNSTIFRSLVVVVPRPVNYFPSDPLWSGSPLASDKFDSLPFGAIPTTMWSTIEQGFASDACGKVTKTRRQE
ncbi:unnamed protein product [Aphanomyces euteiches]